MVTIPCSECSALLGSLPVNMMAVPDTMISGPPMRPSHAAASRHQARAVHQVAEDQPVPPADDPARAEEERPVLDCRERVRDRPLRRTCNLVPQRDDAEHAEDADEDERALDQPRRHVADRQLLVLASDDRDDHDRGADVRDDEQQLKQSAEQDLLVVPGTGDVRHRMSEHRLVKQQRWDRRDERDEVEHAEPTRPLLIYETPVGPLSPGDGDQANSHIAISTG